MKKYIFLISFFLLVPFLVLQAGELHFNRGIAYYLLDDMDLAKKQMELYFLNKSEFQLRNGFMLLLQGKSWDATTKFRDYLEINHRSQIALIGIALSTVKMKNTATIENLERAIRLNPRLPSPYICLGFEYLKKKKLSPG
jgi:tetratricopeptide (TPR) repeat protein